MKIELGPKQEKKFCFIDNNENYMTLGANSPDNGEGLIYKNQVLLSDFCLFAKEGEYKKLYTRFDGAKTCVEPGFFTVDFVPAKQKIVCSLFGNALYFNCQNDGKISCDLVLLPSIDLAKKLDKGQAFAASQEVTVQKPLASELLQLTKVFGKKAAYARLLSFEKAAELYISLDHSPSGSTKAAAKMLKENAFDKHLQETKSLLQKSSFKSQDELFDKALEWAKFSALQFLNKNKTKALWAGLPWFRDYWGRDIFVSIPGTLLLSGNIQEAQNLFENFSQFQDTNPRSVTYGRLPNIYRGSGDVIYNTADASLWFVIQALQTARFSGDKKFLERLWPTIQLALECDRNLRTDSAGFLLHGDADTWMDARIFGEKSFCPRGNRANDIQALWFTALLCGAETASLLGKQEEKRVWEEAASKVKNSFLGKFYDGQRMADCVLRDDAADFRVRPNQLQLATIPKIAGQAFLPKDVEEKIIKDAVQELLFPHGLCSLSQKDPYFHPYHKTWEYYHEDAAYHNGTVWTWNYGFAAGALCSIGEQNLAWRLAQSVAGQVFSGPCAGALSSNLWAYPDQEGHLRFSGAYSSCRSVSEFHRAAWDYFLGMKVDLLQKTIYFCPRIPSEWNEGQAQISLGLKNNLTLQVAWSSVLNSLEERELTFKLSGDYSDINKISIIVSFSGLDKPVELKKTSASVKGKIFCAKDSGLTFAKPLSLEPDWKKPECLLQKNYLAEIALRQEFNPGHPSSLTAIRN
jgi:hypothetical protein